MNSRTNRNARGFSLIEFAIVLGVMGVVIGALWSVVSVVRENIKREQMVEQVTLIVNNIRDFYLARSSVADEAGNSDVDNVTSYLLQRGVLLPENIRNRSGTWRADHPWGPTGASGAQLASGGLAVDGNGDPMNSFRIEIRGLKDSSCIALAAALTGAGVPAPIAASINGTAMALPVSPDEAVSECDPTPAGTQNVIDLAYELRRQ